jgi:hypothetical protein
MAAFRFTSYFQHANFGFSETVWKVGSSIQETFAAYNQLLTRRCKLIPDFMGHIATRISEEGVNRRTRLLLPGNNQLVQGGTVFNVPEKGSYAPGGSAYPPDQIRAALQVELTKNGVFLSRKYMSGIPDKVSKTETGTLDLLNPPDWWGFWRDWSNYFTSNGFAIKSIDKTVANPERMIARYITRGEIPFQLGLVLPLEAALTVVQGDSVFLRAVKMKTVGLESPNGKWIVDEVENSALLQTQTVWLRNALGYDPGQFETLGKVRKVQYVYEAPDLIQQMRVGVHKRGKPGLTPAGRVKTRARGR